MATGLKKPYSVYYTDCSFVIRKPVDGRLPSCSTLKPTLLIILYTIHNLHKSHCFLNLGIHSALVPTNTPMYVNLSVPS